MQGTTFSCENFIRFRGGADGPLWINPQFSRRTNRLNAMRLIESFLGDFVAPASRRRFRNRAIRRKNAGGTPAPRKPASSEEIRNFRSARRHYREKSD